MNYRLLTMNKVV